MKKFFIIMLLALCALPMTAQGRQHNHRRDQRNEIHIVERECPPVASPEQVKEILHYIKSLSFDNDKLSAALLCVKLCPIAAEDMARIVKLFSFEDARVEFLKKAYPYCPDKHHYREAIKNLSFLSSRDDVYNYIEKHYRD